MTGERQEPRAVRTPAWDELEVGQVFPTCYFDLTEEAAEGWRAAWPELPDGRRVGLAGLVPVLVLKAIQTAFGTIPPGSVLAKQQFSFGVEPRIGSRLRTELSVGEKYVRRERPYVGLRFEIRDEAGRLVAEGLKTLVWPEVE